MPDPHGLTEVCVSENQRRRWRAFRERAKQGRNARGAQAAHSRATVKITATGVGEREIVAAYIEGNTYQRLRIELFKPR